MMYSGTLPYGHLTSKVTSPLRLCLLSLVFQSAKYRTLSACNMVTYQLRSFLPSPMGDRNSEVPMITEVYQQRNKYMCHQVMNTIRIANIEWRIRICFGRIHFFLSQRLYILFHTLTMLANCIYLIKTN